MELPEPTAPKARIRDGNDPGTELYHESTPSRSRHKVILISPYELGRQPFGLAQPAAWLADAGIEVECLDLSLQMLQDIRFDDAAAIGLYLGMHTATRIAVEALPKIKELAPGAHLFAFGLYAPVNETFLRDLGISTVFGGESEADITELATAVIAGVPTAQTEAKVHLGKLNFLRPKREILPALSRYAKLVLPDGREQVVGHVEATRGCKHLCRHCPVVPVYQGRFRAIPVPIVMEDIAQQVVAGAEHISFGDPDFLNGPTHALRVIEAMRATWPELTFDATIKIEHMLAQPEAMAKLARSGCLFLTTAVESVEDTILTLLDKNHSAVDFEQAVAQARKLGIALAPTFVAFTPWTTGLGYISLLEHLVRLQLVNAVPTIQLAIRLLIPQGSTLLELDELEPHLRGFDQKGLGYRWEHPDPRVDALQREIQTLVELGDANSVPREDSFRAIWELAHAQFGLLAPALPRELGAVIPAHSEPWYCCAEPTDAQLQSF